MGYLRENGTVGIRNHILVLPSVVCSARAANEIAFRTDVKTCYHQYGCGHVGPDFDFMRRSMSGLARNPNVAAALIVGLGCEHVTASALYKDVLATGKPVKYLDIQESGGTRGTIEKGISIVEEFKSMVADKKREPFPLSKLQLGLECGGSDTTSGLFANPALGVASDKIVEAGGTSILPEFIEWFGAENTLAERFVDPKQAEEFKMAINGFRQVIKEMGLDFFLIAPGNVKGGLTTIEEKAMGNIEKAGKAPIQGALRYSEKPSRAGLWLMWEFGLDVESITGLSASGCQICAFTTGQGTPTGSPIMPVIKITGNPHTYANQSCDMDIDVSKIIEDDSITIESLGQDILNEIVAVASGKETLAEKNDQGDIGFWRPPLIANADSEVMKYVKYYFS